MIEPVIERYNFVERVSHWLSAVAYIYPLLTGLAFYSPHLYWIAYVLGGPSTSRFWHPWFGVAFFAFLLWMLVEWGKDMQITDADRAWGKAIEHYIKNEDEQMPAAGRFNYGQKIFYWVMLFAGIVLLLTGAIMWFPEVFARRAHFILPTAIALHVAAALISIGAFIIHVYMGTAMVRGGVRAMVRGWVTPAWARHHHRLWYESRTQKTDPDRT